MSVSSEYLVKFQYLSVAHRLTAAVEVVSIFSYFKNTSQPSVNVPRTSSAYSRSTPCQYFLPSIQKILVKVLKSSPGAL